MDFTIDVNGVTLSLSSPYELDLTFLQDFLDTLVPVFEWELEEDEEDDGVEYDDEDTAWWYDEVEDEWYYFDEEEWVLYEEDEEDEE